MNVLVTGGSGFIGSHIVDKLIENNYSVTVIDIVPTHRNDIEFIKGSISDRSLLKKIMPNVDYVYHLAAVSNIDHVIDKPIETINYNVMGTAFLLEEARHYKIKRFFLASSVFVFEKSGHLYASSKYFSEILCQNYETLYRLPYTILRFGTAYGPRSRKADVVSIFVDACLNDKDLYVEGMGNQTRNFIYVEDLATGAIKAINKNCQNKIVTIAGNEAIKIIDLAKLIKNICDKKNINIICNKSKRRKDDHSGLIQDIDSINSRLDWNPSTSINAGVKKYLDWLRYGEIK